MIFTDEEIVPKSDIIKKAYFLKKEINDLKEKLKSMEDDYRALTYEIMHTKGIKSRLFNCDRVTVRNVNAEWYKKNKPDFYKKFAHVSHPNAVAIMSGISGGYANFMGYLAENSPEEFDKKAVITMQDVTKYFGTEHIEELTELGAIKEEVKDVKITPKLQWEIEKEEGGFIRA